MPLKVDVIKMHVPKQGRTPEQAHGGRIGYAGRMGGFCSVFHGHPFRMVKYGLPLICTPLPVRQSAQDGRRAKGASAQVRHHDIGSIGSPIRGS